MDVMCSISLNCQVRSFCNVSSAHLDDSPFPPLLFIRLSNLFFPSHLFSLRCQCFLIVLLQHLLISPTFGISWMNRNSGHRSHPFLGAPDHGLFDRRLGSTVNNCSIYTSSSHMNYRLHPHELSSTPTHLLPLIPTSMLASML